jgi:serralysin
LARITSVYLTVDDSLATHAADEITDFEVGIDKIDLSALVAGDLIFVGSGTFSLSDASVRVAPGAGETTIVSIDLDHNGTADMMIVLTGPLALTASDFSL